MQPNVRYESTQANRVLNLRLDRIAKAIGPHASAELLNALHACRPDHPLGRYVATPWSNFWFLLSQAHWLCRRDLSRDTLRWIESKAREEDI